MDPTAPGYGSHLNFDQILRRCGQAWIVFLAEVGFEGGVLVPRVEVDYLAEVGLGALDVAVSVLALGHTSFRLQLDVAQAGVVAASAQAVLVSYDYGGRAPQALTAAQRAALAPHLLAAPAAGDP